MIVPILPKVYKESYREILKADPNAVDLSKLSNYYYHVGNHVKDFNRNDKQEVVNTLRNVRFTNKNHKSLKRENLLSLRKFFKF